MGPALLAFEEVTNVVGVGLGVAGGTDTGMPKFCSTQYEAPDTKVQDDASTGFYSGIRPASNDHRLYVGELT